MTTKRQMMATMKAAGLVSLGLALAFSFTACDSKPAAQGEIVVGMRRLTETQYINTIADIFSPAVKVAGRFEPILRPTHELIATGATDAAISPAGLEQFDAMARGIAAQVFDEARPTAFASCTPPNIKQPDDKCARTVLAPLGRLLFRRPLTDFELDLYLKAARDTAKQEGSFYKGLQLALAAMLVSPDFLFIVESAEPDPQHPGQLRLDSYSRAARLSYVLWNTTPNDQLITAAERGQLLNDAKLQEFATKMVASPRLADGVSAFFADMLVYEKFEDMTKDPVIYPRFNIAVGKDLAEQLRRTILDTVLTEDRDYRDLFTTRKTEMTRSLGPLYHVRVDQTKGWEAAEFDGDRAGLTSQAGFLALYSHPGRSSPTLRGRAIRELLLCQVVPDPPGNVDFKVVQDTNNPVMRTARARLTAHQENPVCAGCHRIMDPIGLTLETFDGAGGNRTQENGADIDTSGVLDGKKFTGAVELGKVLADNPATTQCVTQRAIEYATGRVFKKEDTKQIHAAFESSGYRVRALFQQIATSPSLYTLPAPADQPSPQKTAMNTASTGESK